MRPIDRRMLWALNAVGLRLRGMKMQFPCYVGPTLFLLNRRQIRLGRRVRIWPGLRVEAHNGATLTIEDDVALGPFCHINLAADMTIRKGTVSAGWALITNINHTLEDTHQHLMDRPWEVSPVELGERIFLGQGAKILPGSRLGDDCNVGANAVVSRLDAPPGSTVGGVPARIIRERAS